MKFIKQSEPNRIDAKHSGLDKISGRKKLIYSYTILYFFVSIIATSPFWANDKSFVCGIDGHTMFFPNFVYTGNWVRELLGNFLKGNFTIPYYDLCLGWGGRTVSEGFDLFTLLVSPFISLAKNAETLYSALIFVRIYVAGLAFLYMCRFFGKARSSSLCGCIVYLFSAYTIYCELSFPGFANTMIQLPLLIVGAEKVLRKERAIGFIFAVLLVGISSLHWLYVQTLLLLIYCLVRFFALYPSGNRFRNFWIVLWQGIWRYLLGIGLAAIIVVPSLFGMTTAARSGFQNLNISDNIAVHLKFFCIRFLSLFAPIRVYEWDWGQDYPAYAAIYLFALLALYTTKRGEKRSLKYLNAIGLIMLFCPVFGWVFQVFQYVCNRWTFALALLAGYTTVEMLPELFCMSRKRMVICCSATALFAAASLLFSAAREGVYGLVGVVFLCATLLFFVCFRDKAVDRAKLTAVIRRVLCAVLICANVCTNSIYLCSESKMNWAGWFMPYGYETLCSGIAPEGEAEYIPQWYDRSKGRIDSTTFTYNGARMYGISGTLIYYSLINSNVVDFWLNMEECCNTQYFKIHSTDQRTILNTLISVAVQFEWENSLQYIPFGYTCLGETYFTKIYQNDHALSWGYSYDRSVSYRELEGLNGVQKQEALIQAVALDDGSASLNDLDFCEKAVPYTYDCAGCIWEDGVLTVNSLEGRIRLNAEIEAGKEYYVRIKGLNIEGFGDEYLTTSTAASFDLSVSCGNVEKNGRAMDKAYPWYYGRENYLFCLGCQDYERNSVIINFPAEGKFQLDDIELIELPLDLYPQWADALREEALENITFSTNQISGEIDLSQEKVLCLTVPYENGWKAYVDGVETEILRANYAFMGLKLKAGHHEIVFQYTMPGIRLGALLFVLSLALLIVLCIRWRRKDKTRK